MTRRGVALAAVLLAWFFYALDDSAGSHHTKIAGFRWWTDCEDARAAVVQARVREQLARSIAGRLTLHDIARSLRADRYATPCAEDRS